MMPGVLQPLTDFARRINRAILEETRTFNRSWFLRETPAFYWSPQGKPECSLCGDAEETEHRIVFECEVPVRKIIVIVGSAI